MTPPPPNLPYFGPRVLPVPLLLPFASDDDSEVVASSTLAVAVMAWIFGLVGAITILALRSRATSDQGGPFRMPGGGGVAKGASAGQHVGTV